MNKQDKAASNNGRSIERGVVVLDGMAKFGREISLLELSSSIGLNQSTVYRILSALKKFGYVEQNNTNSRYRLGPAVLTLSSAYMRSTNIREVVFQELTLLRDYCGETVHYGVRSGNELIYVEKIQGIHPVGIISTTIGERAPIHCTAMGKTLLAWLPESAIRDIVNNYPFSSRTPNSITDPELFLKELSKVKQEGFALNREETEIGVAAIAAPIFGPEGVVGSISVTGPANRIYEIISTLNLKEKLNQTSERVSTLLGGVRYFQR